MAAIVRIGHSIRLGRTIAAKSRVSLRSREA